MADSVPPLGVITQGQMRIWVFGAKPTPVDAAHLMHLWDEGNRRVHEARTPGGDRHVQPFEDMMQGFRQLGFKGAPDDGRCPDWYIPLGSDAFDADILARLAFKVRN